MDIKYNVLEEELNKGKLSAIYLLYGNEKYLIDTYIKKIKKNFGELVQGINFIILDEDAVKDLIFNIEVPAFGYDKKLILVRNSNLFKKNGKKKEPDLIQKEICQYLSKNISTISEMNTIVFIEDEVDKNLVYDVVNENGIICNVSELKPIELIERLKKICSLYKVNATNSTLSYLIETSGTNLQILINEIRKLIEYAGVGGQITNQSIDELAIKQMDSVIFDLTDNLGNKKIDKAIEILDNLIYQKEPLQKILVTLYNHFKKLYLCSIALELNKDIATTLNLKPNQIFLIGKYKKQASYFKKSDLKQILHEFTEIDYKSKSGLIDINVALRSVLCGYCS